MSGPNSFLTLVALSTGLLLSIPVHADVVATLKTKLASLEGTQAIAGTLRIQNTSTQGKDPPVTTQAHLSMAVRDGPQGLELHFPVALLRKVRAEQAANAKQANTPEPIQNLLSSIDPTQLMEILSYAPDLLRKMQGATLLKQSTVQVRGTTQQLLEFKMPPKMSKQDQDGLQSYRGRMDVWLNQAGIPVAVRQSMSIAFRKFFVIHINVKVSVTENLIIWKGHLVLSQMHHKTQITGIQTSSNTERYRFQPTAAGRSTPPPATQPASAALPASALKPRKMEAAASRPS